MEQMTLTGKPKTESVYQVKNPIKERDIETESPKYNSEKDHAVFELSYHKEVLADGSFKEWLSTDQTVEYANHMGSSYGGGGYYSVKMNEEENISDLGELEESILAFFRDLLEKPYVEFNKNKEDIYGFYVSDMKPENITLAISPKGLDFLKRSGFPYEQLLTQIEKLKKERPLFTKEYQNKIELYIDMEKFVEDTDHQISDLMFAIIERGKTFKEVMDINPMWNKLNDLIQQIKDINEEYSNLHKFFYGWVGHTRMEWDNNWFQSRYNQAKAIVNGT